MKNLLFAAILALSPLAAQAADLDVNGQVKQELHLSVADLAKMPQTEVTATDKGNKVHKFKGVWLDEVLTQAGAPLGPQAMRGKSVAMYLVAQAQDGYKAVFSLAELDPGLGSGRALVAISQDGQPLPKDQGPLRLVVATDKRPTRWVYNVRTLTLDSAK